MNKLVCTNNMMVPSEIRPAMIYGNSCFLPIEDLGESNQKEPKTICLSKGDATVRDALRSYVNVARTSKQMFTNMVHDLRQKPLFKSLVSTDISTDNNATKECSLYQAFSPVTQFVKTMKDLGQNIFLQHTARKMCGAAYPECSRKNPESFFDVLWNISWSIGLHARCNIIKSIPRFIFEASLKSSLPENTISLCREEYKKYDGGEALDGYIASLRNIQEDDVVTSSTEAEIIKAITYFQKNILMLPERYRSEKQYVKAAIISGELFAPDVLEKFGAPLNKNRDSALVAITAYGFLLEVVPAFQADEEVVLAAVKSDGTALEFVAPHLTHNYRIVFEAVKNDGAALMYASDLLRNNREIALAAVQNSGSALDYVFDLLKDDREIVLAAVQNDGDALEYASDHLKNDREIVLAAVQNSGFALEYASDLLKNDKEIVLAAVTSNARALGYASSGLRRDMDIICAALRRDGTALQYVYPIVRTMAEVVHIAVQNAGLALKHAYKGIRKDQKIVLTAVKNDGLALEYADDKLKNNWKIALSAIENNARAIEFATSLKDTKDFILQALKKNPYVFKYLSAELKNDPAVHEVLKNGERAWENIA